MSSQSLRLVVAAGLTLASVGLVGCNSSASEPSNSTASSGGKGGNPAGCITDFDADKDYFPEKTSFTDAKGLVVEYHKSYKVVTVKTPSPGAKPESYVLVQCGAPEPNLSGKLANAQKVQIPVKRMAISSTTQVPAVQMLGASEQVVGVSDAKKLHDGEVKKAADAGRVKSYQNDDYSVNAEKVLALKPDLFFTSGMGDPAYAKLKQTKIPVVANAEWLETTPLGRSEWIKYPAVFLNKEAAAQTVYSDIATKYHDVAEKLSQVKSRPTVLAGSQTKGTWYIPSGGSYVAAFIKDAGGTYVFANKKGTGNDPTSTEEVLKGGSKADFWFNGQTFGNTWKTAADITKDDPRYAQLAAVKKGNVWNPTLRINEAGGNDYWQLGLVRPDLVLGDMAAALHPEVMGNHEFTFYRQVK